MFNVLYNNYITIYSNNNLREAASSLLVGRVRLIRSEFAVDTAYVKK